MSTKSKSIRPTHTTIYSQYNNNLQFDIYISWPFRKFNKERVTHLPFTHHRQYATTSIIGIDYYYCSIYLISVCSDRFPCFFFFFDTHFSGFDDYKAIRCDNCLITARWALDAIFIRVHCAVSMPDDRRLW